MKLFQMLGMEFEKVLEEKVPLHARFYGWYVPENGRNYEKWPPKEDLQEEIDDMSEDDDTNGWNEYDNGKAYVPEIRRAIKNDDEEEEFESEFEEIEYFSGEVVDHRMYNIFIPTLENEIRKYNWGIKNFKIFHIWNISLNNKKPALLPWSAKFQSDENKIELEIGSKKIENGTGQTKVVNFSIDTQACDVPLFAIVDDCKIKYSLLSNAIRVEFEVRAYNDDGSPALDVDGHIRVEHDFREVHEKYIFGGHNRCEGRERTAENALILSPSSLIIPRDLGLFYLGISLKDKDGKFVFKEVDEVVWRRTVAVDEQHCILGQKGWIILTTIWSCLCVDSKHGICTCPGTAMGTFRAEENDNAEDKKDEPVNYTCYPTATYNEDGVVGDLKRAKVRQPRQICSTNEEATTWDEDSK